MRPASQSFGVEEKPPARVVVFSALQHLAMIAPVGLICPLLVVSHAGADRAVTNSVLAMSMLALGFATILQCMRWKGVGSGFLAPAIFTSAYLPPSLAAAQLGGLPLVFGMTVFAGACQIILSLGLKRLRPFFPAEIAGLAVTMIGVSLGMLGLRLLFGLPGGVAEGALSAPQTAADLGIAVFGLLVIVVLSVWAPKGIRIYAVLLALIVAWLVALVLGAVDTSFVRAGFADGLVRLPRPVFAGLAFDPGLAIAFAVGALACTLCTVGNVTTCQKINDSDWQRPEMNSLKGGVFADGLGTILAGFLGTVGLNTFSASIGLSAATGVMARRVGFAVGAIFIGFAFVPGAIALAGSIPLPLTGAILVFTSSFIVVSGIQVILSRLLDNRKTLVIGFGLLFGLSRDILPEFYGALPSELTPLASSSLVVALLVAGLLNLVFRIGVSDRARLVLVPGTDAVEQVHAFCETQGGAWAARRDVMQRVTAALVEFAEISGDVVRKDAPATIDLKFDEYRIDAFIRYKGERVEAPVGAGGSASVDLLESDDLPGHIPFLIIGKMADRFTSGQNDRNSWLRLSFEH